MADRLRGRFSTCLTVAAHLLCGVIQAQAAEFGWRSIPVRPATDRYGHPPVSDVTQAPDGALYVLENHGIHRVEDGEFHVVDGYYENLRMARDGERAGEYVVMTRNTGRYADKYPFTPKATFQLPKEQLSGIVTRIAADTDGSLWAVTRNGRVGRWNNETWHMETVRASEIVIGPHGRRLIWNNKPTFSSHRDWLADNHDHPMLWDGQTWQPEPALQNVHAAAVDASGQILVLLMDPDTREHRLVIGNRESWRPVDTPPNLRNIQSDIHGEVLALSYRSQKIDGQGYERVEDAVHVWRDGAWVADPELTHLPKHIYLGSGGRHGKLVRHRGHRTLVSANRWRSWLELTPEQLARKRAEEQAPPPVEPERFDASGSRWFGTIVALDDSIPIEPNLKALWGRGAYLHLREDGALGFKWNEADALEYLPENTWQQDGEQLILRLGVFHYVFTLAPPNQALRARLADAFRMEITRQ